MRMLRSSRLNISIFLYAGCATACAAQTLYVRDANVIVSANTTLSVRGSVENEGTLANNGHLKVGGPWINSGTYVPGEGEITFNSASATVPQIIHHNGQTFNRVTIAGGTAKIILSDMVVGKRISFDHGIIEAAGDSRLIFGSGAVVMNASDSSHVHGAVFQKGSGRKLFPLGNGLLYQPVELVDVEDPAAFIGIEAFEFEYRAGSASLESIADDRYWHIDVSEGTLGRSRIVIPLRDATWAAGADDLVVAQSTAPTETFTSIGRSVIEEAGGRHRITSEMSVSLPFVALARAGREAELVVYNAVSNNGDDMNDFLRIENIGNYPDNRFTVFNRWGDRVFEVEQYDNVERVFRGRSNIGHHSDLASGTYFYVLEIPGLETIRGFVAVRN